VSNAGPDDDSKVVVARLRAELAALRRSRRRLVEADLADRRALERTLHDGVQQRLVALATDIQYMARQLERDPASAKPLFEEAVANLREALTEATTLAQLVYPPLLDGRGLATSLRSAAVGAGLTVVVGVPEAADYPPEVGAAIYWTCAEALAAASPGSEATIRVDEVEGGVSFEVAVAGRLSTALSDRLGDRVEALDGRLSVDGDGLGSRVQGWLPLSR
jgi:signal transduction histidine kinase